MGSQTCRPRQPRPLSDDQEASLGLEDARTRERKFTQKYPQFTQDDSRLLVFTPFRGQCFLVFENSSSPFLPKNPLPISPIIFNTKISLRR